EYQGCAKSGFCYPPMQKVMTINWREMKVYDHVELSPTPTRWQVSRLLTDHLQVKELLTTDRISISLLVFFVLGFLLAFTPCVLPMLPILTTIIIGHKHHIGTWRAFILSTSYVLGMALTYACAGVFAAMLGSSLQVLLQKP